jgi:hypothetical protein
MNRQVTERDFRRPEFVDARPEDYEFRADGTIVRKDRWEQGIHHIHSIVGPHRREFEIPEVIDAVRRLRGNWFEADPDEDPEKVRLDLKLACGSVLAGCHRIGPFAYHWAFGDKSFGPKDFGADVVEWQESKEA